MVALLKLKHMAVSYTSAQKAFLDPPLTVRIMIREAKKYEPNRWTRSATVA
jgi:hypothetical protein